jgi:hypothetical protein
MTRATGRLSRCSMLQGSGAALVALGLSRTGRSVSARGRPPEHLRRGRQRAAARQNDWPAGTADCRHCASQW